MKRTTLTLSLLTLLALTSACNQADDYYEKATFSALSDPTGSGSSAPGIPIVTLPEDPKTPATPETPEVPVPPPVVGNPGGDIPESDLCKLNPMAAACQLEPVVKKAGVVTILLALGDIAQQQIVITEDSARLIAVNAVKYASPKANPKILVIKDSNHNGESVEDTDYIAKTLLGSYSADVLTETAEGIRASDLKGYDLIWFNNPGHPMGNVKTKNLLKQFDGGVILSGDDLSQGKNFATVDLTGLISKNNGTKVQCDGKTYYTDNNGGQRFKVIMDQKFLPGIPESILSFEYGNDIDLSVLTGNGKYEVLASAKLAVAGCKIDRPVIVRYEK